MPGTIQVTVLEFKGFSSSSKASAKSLKVSMGKRQFQTWDKGDFSFPITKLGENLVVSLLDAGGNEIAHQDIRTMQIIEKGNWDEVFAINGSGHAHMKLRFVLSDEERHRIRLMRESAVKKKLETNPSIKLRLLQVSDSVETSTINEHKISDEVSPKVEGSQAGSSTSSAIPSPSALIPYATDVSQGAKPQVKSESPKMQETVPVEPLAIVSSEGPGSSTNDTPAPKLHDDQDSVEKTSSIVRKMISALESSKLQKVKSISSVPAQLNRFRKANVLSEDQESKPDKTAEPVADIIPSQAPKELSSTETSIPSGENDLQELKISPVDLMRQSTSETATGSGRMPEEQTQPYELSSNSIDSTETETSSGRMPEEQSQPYELSSNSINSSETATSSGRMPEEQTQPCKLSSNSLNSTETATSSGRMPEEQAQPYELSSNSINSLETATSSGRMPEEQAQLYELSSNSIDSTETATISGRMPEEQAQPYELSSNSIDSTESSVVQGSGRGRGTSLESSIMIIASNKKPTLEDCNEECYSGQTSGMWIFPDNTTRLCVTTAGHHQTEAKSHQVENISSKSDVLDKRNVIHETEFKTEKKQNKAEAGSGSSPNGSFNGVVGQVIKIGVIIGFGVLVLLTRQKEPRKKHREENGNLFHVPKYV